MNSVLKETTLGAGRTLQLVQGDIALEKTDAIVNAANQYLRHGAGVAGAFLRRGGADIQAESDAWVRTHGPVTHESPARTSGGRLAAKYVIHAVGPVWGEGGEQAKLAAAVHGSLRTADELGLESISMPALSTGIFGFPKEKAAGIILSAIQAYFTARQSGLKLIRLVLFDDATIRAFQSAWDSSSE
ncbi:MAG: macro domain-containing protein [Chloroflexota bacterium]